MASYVPRPSTSVDEEAVEFYGKDGRWRRLDLGDLNLPPDAWTGGDTYGAGALSPDGRWWAGTLRDGMLLVDLSDGTASVRDVEGGGGASSYDWSPDSDELVLILSGRSTRVSVPDLQIEAFPRPWAYPTLLADGSWVECPDQRLVVVQCSTYAPDGSLVDEQAIPDDLLQKSFAPVQHVGNSVFYDYGDRPYENARGDQEILRANRQFEVDARLVLPRNSEISGADDLFEPVDEDTLGLVAIDEPMLMAWLVDPDEIVKVIAPGRGIEPWGLDFWDVVFANDLVAID